MKSSLKLKNLTIKIGSGSTPRGGKDSYLEEGVISLIRSQNVYNHEFTTDGRVFISEEQAKKLNNVTLQKNDVLLNITGDSVARCCIVPETILPARVNQHVAIIRCDTELLNPHYLLAVLTSPLMQQYLLSIAQTGGTRAALTKGMIENLDIPYVPLIIQNQIGNLLNNINSKIECNNASISTLNQLTQTIFKYWFIDYEFPNEHGEPYNTSGGSFKESDLGYIPTGWEVRSLGELIEFQNGYAFKSKELLKQDTGDTFHVFKMGHINKGGGLNKSGTKSYIEREKCKRLNRYIIKKGDLLMCMTDMKSNVALLGHTALMDEDDKYILNQRVGLIRTYNPEILNYSYLYLLTNSPDFIENLRNRANSGVQVNLTTKEIKDSLIVVPNSSVHKKFDLLVSKLFDKIFLLNHENVILKNLRDSLLPKILSGEIEIPLESEEMEHVQL
ncbi:restriction endonuclease subunit S [Mesobacillus selenatarsenatis]|uniref:Type I restriction-modification system, specificity subunit S n=1 Tax=Mesobacillus selenatarsenatis (strain DSM 18680 / JCM 14380 / FERM P-15431 / SF-1) TaxID=1321606 RepID=A0A0A8X2Q3_MESS1|nr:restriction endonuclease subunit S [Mesobacillus selenatarsenatis]GAM14265.1 type I restriction-modification system, specificity subunit S [Mesobacillus selenatarsenatis SF-1]